MLTNRQARRDRGARLNIESLEGRAQLSPIVLSSATNVLIAHVTPLPPAPPKPVDPKAAAAAAAAASNPNLKQNLMSITHSSVYKTLGTSYVRQIFSADTYAVTRSYKNALYTLNFREIRQINRSHYLKVVGDQFTAPLHSPSSRASAGTWTSSAERSSIIITK